MAGYQPKYGTIPDSGYGTTSGFGRLSAGRRSAYGGSVASLSTVARVDVGGLQIDNQSTASCVASEHGMPGFFATRHADGRRSSQIHAPQPDYILGSPMMSRDPADLCSNSGINDRQS
ncbi:hypothetical protein SCUCBS95973_007646, partial [Sporothrix curviconia]